MTPAPRIGWFGRTLGWSGTRAQWITLFGLLAWLAGFVFIGFKAHNWTIGQTLLALSGWVFVLGLAARDAVRDLFGPVFFYDLLRVGRNRTTFILRGLYVVGLGMLMSLMYFEWLFDQGQQNNRAWGEFCLLIAAGITLAGFLITRELRDKSVRGAAVVFGALSVASVLGLLILAIGYFTEREEYQYGRGQTIVAATHLSRFANQFFEVYVVVQFIVITLLTPVYVAGTIAVEKERKTLEFLFATDLRNREIIFGKLASRVLMLVMYVLAGLPLLAFLQLFGGIDPEQLLAAVTATITMTIGLSAISIWVSTTLKRARDAIVLSYLLAVVYGFVSFFLAVISMIPFGIGWWNTPVTLAGYSLGINDLMATFADGNPVFALFKISNGVRAGLGGTTLGIVLREFVVFWFIASALLLGIAIFRLRRVALGQAYGPVQKRSLFIHPRAKSDDPRQERRERRGRPAVGGNPVLWKEVFVDATFRGGCLGKIVGGVILALVIVPFLMLTYFEFFEDLRFGRGPSSFSNQWERYQREINGWVRITTGVLGLLMFIAAAMRAASAICGEKDKDTWISLIGTPMSAEDILIGKWWGCILSLRRAFLVMIIVWAIGLAVGAVNPIMIPVMLFLTAVYVSAFSWIGLLVSISARNSLRASIWAFFTAVFAAGGFWVVLGLCCFLPISIMRIRGDTPEMFGTFMLGWTPPLVYGVFPLRILESDELGPFDNSRDYSRSAGLVGPIIGTMFWIVFSLMMKLRCETMLRRLTNRDPQEPQRAPREKKTGPAQG